MTFPLDYLKIDRGFINAIEGLEIETPVLDAIINLCHKLQLEVLGEGVETALQFQYLQQRGVVFIQGYYYARPMDNNQLRARLNQQGRQPLPLRTTMSLNCIILDDYQNVALSLAGWASLQPQVQTTALHRHYADEDELVAHIAHADILVVMRERTRSAPG